MADKLPKFAKRKTNWYLLWTAPNGVIAGAYFETWEDLETFSRACVKRGLCPWVPLDVPAPYDGLGCDWQYQGCGNVYRLRKG
jgi:hypothetical protein